MTQPTDGRSGQEFDQATTHSVRDARHIQDFESRVPAALETQPLEPGYVKEPLFSKKVMFVWAAAAFVVWFAFTFIAPVVIDSVKSAALSKLGEPVTNTSGKTVIRTKNGVTITRTERGVTIDRDVKAPPAPAEPIVAPAPLPPATEKK